MMISLSCTLFNMPCFAPIACETHFCSFCCKSMAQSHAVSTIIMMIGHDGGYKPLIWSSQSLKRLISFRHGHAFGHNTHLNHALPLMPCIRFSSMIKSLAKVCLIPPSPSHLQPGLVFLFLGKVVLVEEDINHENTTIGEPILEGIPVGVVYAGTLPLLPHKIIPLFTSANFFSGTSFEGTQVLSPTSPLDRRVIRRLPPFSVDKGKVVLVEEDINHENTTIGEPILEGIPVGVVYAGTLPLLPHKIIPLLTSTNFFSGTSFEGTQVLCPTSPLDRVISPNQEGDSGSQGFENAMDYGEEGNDMYLELEDLNNPVVSTESSKKWKIEEGDECSFHPFN
ncbi:hypothetical protein Cgig2_013538 [Carnegiea gigantea]|uniref:Uncharacterized protein n=1 Tax=Carnegiea gigantea TaxID=171969 RepID=A0A9Q1Q6X2_9CARY|nr:hypothetical protein Cgig2_013538 [Carnegiea gigantea]